MWLAPSSGIKGRSDMKKFTTAQKLKVRCDDQGMLMVFRKRLARFARSTWLIWRTLMSWWLSVLLLCM